MIPPPRLDVVVIVIRATNCTLWLIWIYTCMSCYTSILFPGESVANVVEGDGQVLRAAQRRKLTIGWRVVNQAWVDEPTDKRV